jgi:hypothetical protein
MYQVSEAAMDKFLQAVRETIESMLKMPEPLRSVVANDPKVVYLVACFRNVEEEIRYFKGAKKGWIERYDYLPDKWSGKKMKRPLVMFGDTRSNFNRILLARRGWGRMFATAPPTPFPFERWGFDNGAYKAWQDAGFPRGLTVEDWCILFPVEEFERRLREAMDVDSDPLVAVVPDIPGSAASLDYSINWRLDLAMPGFHGWPWYLAVQDGMTVEAVEENLHMFAGIFLGGTDDFKLTAYRWARLAHKHGRKFHYGRAGTLRKVEHAFRVQADSLDSNFPLWTKERTRLLCAKWDGLGLQEQIVGTYWRNLVR